MEETLLNLGLPQNFVKCGICDKVYTNPQQLECLHSFCEGCICQHIDDAEQVICPKCEQSRGLSQKKNDVFIDAVLDLADTSKEYACKSHNIKSDLFCDTCHVIICKDCQTEKHAQCFVVLIESNLDELVLKENVIACEELKKVCKTSKGIYQNKVHEQQKEMQIRSETSSKIATFFYNLKKKLVKQLAEQEQSLQDQLNNRQSENEDLLGQEIQLCKNVSERIQQDLDMLGSLGKTAASLPQLRLMELVKSEITSLESKSPTVERSSIEFCPDEGELNSMFGIKPCHLKVSTGEMVEFVHGSQKSTRNYKAEDFMSYNQEPRTLPQEARIVSQEPTTISQESETIPTTESRVQPTAPQTIAINQATGEVIEHVDKQFFKYGDYVKTCQSTFTWDAKSSVPVGMTWINETHLLIVDRFNHKLKLLTDDGELVSFFLVMGGEPWDVVYTSQKTDDLHFCAVSVPSSKTILYIRVNRNKIEVVRSVKTCTGYCSLGHDKTGHALVCGVCPPFGAPGIHIINIDGAILREFAADGVGIPLFEYPRSIDVTPKGIIIVCDWKKRRLLFMKTDGLILGEYRGSSDHPLTEPIGTTLDGFGNILVSDTTTNSIQAISIEDRQYVWSLKTAKEIKHPREIAITHVGNYPRLAVAVSHHVLIFDLWTSDVGH